jgi:hypothetical protein
LNFLSSGNGIVVTFGHLGTTAARGPRFASFVCA